MFCHQCGASIPDTVRFCVKCGAPVRDAAEKAAPAPRSAEPSAPPVKERSPKAKPAKAAMPKRTLRLIFLLALIAAFGLGVLTGFLIGSAVADNTGSGASAPLWTSGALTVNKNDSGNAYAAFSVTAGADAKKLYAVVETRQDGTLLRSSKCSDDGRMFTDVEEGDELRVKLFPAFDTFAPVDGAFEGADGESFRKGKQVPLEALLDSGLSGSEYTFYFYDGNTCVGQCVLTIDFQ